MSSKWLLLFVTSVVVCGVLEALPIDSDLSPVMENLETQENAFPVQPRNEGGQLVREKRTIGFLRQLFPTLSQIIDRKIQAITRILFRLIGRLVLRGAAGGGGGGGGGTDSDSSGGDNGRRISITLPTFPPSADEDEDSTDSDDVTPGSEDSTTTTTEPSDTENAVAESKLDPVLVRKARQAQSAAAEEEEDDQAAEATGDNELEDSDDADTAESVENPEDRDKRLVNFNLGGGSGGSGGGSGNFLFDIIRLVAGSGTTQAEDEANNAPLEDGNVTAAKGDDGYSAGVPGPLTRLFVIANRGIANLIQDLILRLAQTSERIVNFKARLITSII